MTAPHILIVEDEEQLAAFLELGLTRHGFEVTVVADGLDAVACVADRVLDLIVLDIGLPSLDGFGVLHRIRRAGHDVPVIVLTARSSVEDTVAGLEGGADDYLAKPFRFEELLARVRLRLRDRESREALLLRHGSLTLDVGSRCATTPTGSVELSQREFALASFLLRNPDQVLSRARILDEVWGLDFDPESNIVNVYVRYLRRKIGEARIETVRGVGYRLVDRDG